MARWAAEGRKVVLVVCTNGDKGTSDRSFTPAKLAETREKEQEGRGQGARPVRRRVLAESRTRGLEDNDLLREAIVRQIRVHRPENGDYHRPEPHVHPPPRPPHGRPRHAGRGLSLRAGPPGLSRASRGGAGASQGQAGVPLGYRGSRTRSSTSATRFRPSGMRCSATPARSESPPRRARRAPARGSPPSARGSA